MSHHVAAGSILEPLSGEAAGMPYTSDPATEPDPGCLGEIPGQFIAQGSATLPHAESATRDSLDAEVWAAWAGQLRITYRRQRMRHGRHSRLAWVAISAVRLPG